MTEQTATKPEYGNWVSKKLIYGAVAMSVLFLGLSLLLPILAIVAAFFLLSTAYFLYARHQFSARGANLQVHIRQLVLDHLDWDGKGKALDIGCGNGALAIEIAKKYPQAQVTGIDYGGECGSTQRRSASETPRPKALQTKQISKKRVLQHCPMKMSSLT